MKIWKFWMLNFLKKEGLFVTSLNSHTFWTCEFNAIQTFQNFHTKFYFLFIFKPLLIHLKVPVQTFSHQLSTEVVPKMLSKLLTILNNIDQIYTSHHSIWSFDHSNLMRGSTLIHKSFKGFGKNIYMYSTCTCYR